MGFSEKMPVFVSIAMFTVTAFVNQQRCSPPFSTVNLSQNYQFQVFSEAKKRYPRNAQQGIEFISPDSLAVFQVERVNRIAPLTARDETGGAGSFVLHIAVLRTSQGQSRVMDLTTNGSDVSRVYPTHNGKFIVRTGNLIRLYSSNLVEIASRLLPRSDNAQNESWTLEVDKWGSSIYLEHYEYFGPAVPPRTERFQADADNLQTIAISDSKPNSTTKEQLVPHWERQFPKASLTTKNEHIASVLGNGLFLLAEITRWRRDPFDIGIPPVPLRIVIYDLKNQSERCFISIQNPVSDGTKDGARLYAISERGTVVVIQGTTLYLYHP